MTDDSYFITPHEAALAVVATAMKKARLRLDTLIVNSIIGGILFSAGGMLHIIASVENPVLSQENPGIVRFMQGMVYPIGLFYVIMMGAELFNSNILYFSVGVCRGAVGIFDLLISWFISWLFNILSNLFVCYFVMHLSGIDQTELYTKGTVEMGLEKTRVSFLQTFIRACAANWCVCLAVYLQLFAKPIHVKLIVMTLPIFTFVSVGFNHVVADMFIIPSALFIWLCPTSATQGYVDFLRESSHLYDEYLSVGIYIWRTLIPATLGNALGGALFGIVVVWYSHLVVVERDRKMLNLPTYDAKDEQPELAIESRVVRVIPSSNQEIPSNNQEVPSNNQEIPDSLTSSEPSAKFEKFDVSNPVSYRPGPLSEPLCTLNSRRSSTHSHTSKQSFKSPPGVFPVLGMGPPLAREKTIACANIGLNDEEEMCDIGSYTISFESRSSALKHIQHIEEKTYKGYNVRDHTLGETLKRAITGPSKRNIESGDRDIEHGLRSRVNSFSSTLNKVIPHNPPEASKEAGGRLNRHSIAHGITYAADNVAGVKAYNLQDAIRKPSPALKKRTPTIEQDVATPPLQRLDLDIEVNQLGTNNEVSSIKK